MINWHHLFGLTLKDLFTDTGYQVELEKEVSQKLQFVDVVIIEQQTALSSAILLPDGLDNLAVHNLLTYAIGHFVVRNLNSLYCKEGVDMSLIFEDLLRMEREELLQNMTFEERLSGVPPEERLKGLPPETRIKGLPVEERLRGLSVEEVKTWLARHKMDAQ